MENTKKKMILAVLSQCVAERDKAAFTISSLLDKGFSHDDDNVLTLKKEFEKFSQSEISIESIQIYYATNFPPEPEIKKSEKTNDTNDNNT